MIEWWGLLRCEKITPADRINMPKKKTLLQDEKIQGTNDSSIVSKRSVEKLYKPKSRLNSTEFYRHFVAKYQRRSPIINRGYWTRMEAMKESIEGWIKTEAGLKGKKVVANLGCGYDPYAFELLNEMQDKDMQDVVFLDIDYPDLMKKKVQMLQQSPDLSRIVGQEVSTPKPSDHIIFQTSNYICMSCDLRQLDLFGEILASLFDLDTTRFLFTAEVSITYMTQPTADALIAWTANTLKYSYFVLLEQIMPGKETHPFAETMLKHFNSLNTPLHSVKAYHTIEKQRQRFLDRGWQDVKSCNLFDIWQSLPQEKRDFVESVEEFDEWEEFILFCQHYVVVRASNQPSQQPCSIVNDEKPAETQKPVFKVDLQKSNIICHRRFAAGTQVDNHTLMLHGGLDTNRLNSSLIIKDQEASSQPRMYCSPEVSQRLCHTATTLPNGDILLVGGRFNPLRPLKDCWLYSAIEDEWIQVDDLPEPRYRHSAFVLNNDEVAVFGGMTTNVESNAWLIWNRVRGWRVPNISIKNSDVLTSRNSSALAWDSATGTGVLIGGMDQHHDIHNDAYKIELDSDSDSFKISLICTSPLLQRYGAQALFTKNHTVALVGGVSPHRMITEDDFIVEVDVSSSRVQQIPIKGPLPFLGVGFNLGKLDDKIVLYGGGCVCFSFGSFWNNVYVIQDENNAAVNLIEKMSCQTIQANSSQGKKYPEALSETTNKDITKAQFERICNREIPFLFRNMNLGRCVEDWTWDYLGEKVGAERQMVVHVSDKQTLSFTSKNFKYEEMSFSNFLTLLKNEKKNVYLRAVSESAPKETAAKFGVDFPTIAQDVVLPEFAKHIQTNHFSSPLRVTSANTSVWLHYDVTANILCQIRGHKVVRLYPPSDVPHLSFPPGSSSSTIVNIFDISVEQHRAEGLHPVETVMGPGDILFIPSMWLHATKPTTQSVSLNYFWKNLDATMYAAGSDIYGNRDLAAYENGRKTVAKLRDSFKNLPLETRTFYLARLAQELQSS